MRRIEERESGGMEWNKMELDKNGLEERDRTGRLLIATEGLYCSH